MRRSTREAASPVELRQLRAFVALAESGSVTAAARRLDLAQSTVSEALASLERGVGSPIVRHRRGARSASLTDAGAALLPRAREVLEAVERMHLAVAATATNARGAVEIIANDSISTYVLPRVLAAARARWPNTQFSIEAAACSDVRRGVRQGRFDLGLLIDGAGDTRASGARLAGGEVVAPHVRLVAFASPSHPLAGHRGRAAARRALEAFPVFVSDAAGDFRAIIDRYFRADGLRGPRLQSTGTIEGVKKGVLVDRRALGILPAYAIAGDLASGRVVALPLRPPLPAMRMLAYASDPRHPSVGELLEAIRGAFTPSGDILPRPRASSHRPHR